jgi:hypothetical protein
MFRRNQSEEKDSSLEQSFEFPFLENLICSLSIGLTELCALMTSGSASFPSPSSEDEARSRRRALLARLRSGAASPSPPSVGNLSSTFARVALADDGGVDASQRSAVRVTSGECVFVVHDWIDMTSNSELCGVAFGNQNKLCFRVGCGVASHEDARITPGFNLPPGIYVKTGWEKDTVYNDPVGDLSLLEKHKDEILETSVDFNPANWTTRFNTWENTCDPSDAQRVFSTIRAAKASQTPKKRENRPQEDQETFTVLFQHLEAEDILGADILREHLESYENIWNGSATDGGKLDPAFSLGNKLLEVFKVTGALAEASLSLSHEQTENRLWTEQVVDEAALRITELEKVLGSPSGESATVWSAISTLTSGCGSVHESVERALTKVVAVENELEGLLVGLGEFKNTLSTRMKAIEAGAQDETPSLLEDEFRVLKEEKESLQHRLDMLEARMDVDNSKIVIGSSILRSPLDLSTYCASCGLPDGINFGGLVDVYTLLLRIQSRMDSVSLDKMVKTMKDVKSLDLTVAEATVVHSHSGLIPQIFGKVVEGNACTHLSKLPNHEAWRNRVELTGLAYTIEKSLNQVRKEVSNIISQTLQGPEFLDLRQLATTILLNAESFLSSLIRWVDETHEHLIDGGNPASAVWSIITKVLKEIFEDYLSPARTTGIDGGFTDRTQQSSVMIWGAAKTDVAVVKMMDSGIRNHPVVVGAYAQWMVSNSGLRESASARKEASAAKQAVSDLKSQLAEQSKSLSEARSKIDVVKKIADKAHQKAFS